MKSSFSPFKSAAEITKYVKVNGILNIFLVALVFEIVALAVVSFNHDTKVEAALIYFIIATFSVMAILFVGILIFGDPKWLQSEEHTEKMIIMEVNPKNQQGWLPKQAWDWFTPYQT